jgi:thiamine pyrophosphate-dependent acetolactate synthase large subunit-like protein
MSSRIPLVPALRVLARLRTDQIVVTTMGSAREWPKLSSHPLDLLYLPSAMSQATSLGLGLALAQPQREVIVINGDGSLLMNLGTLVTIAASGAANLTVVLLENGIYEVTGGQDTPAAHAPTDFAAIARGAGIATCASFAALRQWEAAAAGLLAAPGPRFVNLQVEPERIDYRYVLPGPWPERLARFQVALSS